MKITASELRDTKLPVLHNKLTELIYFQGKTDFKPTNESTKSGSVNEQKKKEALIAVNKSLKELGTFEVE